MDKRDSKIKRTLKGVVVSANMDKTIVVAVNRMKQHPKYQKRYRVTKRYQVHDAQGEYREGDQVVFRQCRPLSRTKRFYAVPKASKK